MLLRDLLGQVAGCFPRRETRQAASQMVNGLLMELEDRNCWSIAEAVGHRGPHRLQHLLSRAVWDGQQVLDAAAAWAVAQLDDGDAVLVVDETADEKSSAGAASAVGAARQYSGTAGGVALCQVAVTLTFATSRGHALIGRSLYLPGECAADEEHRAGRITMTAAAAGPVAVRVVGAGGGGVRSVPGTGVLHAGPDEVFQACAGLSRRLAGQLQAQPGLFLRARPRGAAACPQIGLRAAGHHTCRHLRDIGYGQHRCRSIAPGGT